MLIRAYRESELEAVAMLFTASVHALAAEKYDARQRAAWAPQPPDLGHWRARLSGVETLVCEACGDLLGFIGFDGAGHIDLLFTSPTAPRRGVASALYDAAERELERRGVIELFTEASLLAKPFFARQGFAVVEEQNVARGDVFLRRYAMRKTLGSAVARR